MPLPFRSPQRPTPRSRADNLLTHVDRLPQTRGSVVEFKPVDRRHEVGTGRSPSKPRGQRISGEIPNATAPSSEALDGADIAWRLEDRAFKRLMPFEYKAVSRLVNRKRADREIYTRKCEDLLEEALEDARINGTVYGRTKHLYSIYQKLRRYHACGRAFREIHDLTALRVIVDSVADCYLALGVVHQKWRPVCSAFDDYIANPKQNLYRSLHTVVIGPEGYPLEVQIRTREMHRAAEDGFAAHSSYKSEEARENRSPYRTGQPRREESS